MRSFGKALRNIRHTPYQSISAILVLTTTFFVSILIGFITISLTEALDYFESRPQVLVFFDTTASEDGILELKKEFESRPEISQAVYVPQEEALEIYQELNKNDPLLLELVTADILPASLEISALNLETLKAVKEEIQSAPGVEEVVLRSEVVDTLEKWLNGVKYAGGMFVGIMSVTSMLIIMVVVGMKISSKRYEIRVMRLMGAGSWYIQGPYLFEGALYGFLSATIAYATALSFILYASPYIINFAGEVPLIPETPYYILGLYGVSSVFGIVIGIIGSFIAVKRHLSL